VVLTPNSIARCLLLSIALTIGCTAFAPISPAINPNSSRIERQAYFQKYRLRAIDEETIERDKIRLDVGDLVEVTQSCPEAASMYADAPLFPQLMAGVGGGLMGFGAGGLIFADDDESDSSGLNKTLIGVGAGVAAVAMIIAYATAPDSPNTERLAFAYNRCLKTELELVRSPALKPSSAPGLEPAATATTTLALLEQLPKTSSFASLPSPRKAQFRQDISKVFTSVEADFPRFVATLVAGTFEAIVNASIEQMNAYVDLMQSVSESVDEFNEENTTNSSQAREHRRTVATTVMMGINRVVVSDDKTKKPIFTADQIERLGSPSSRSAN